MVAESWTSRSETVSSSSSPPSSLHPAPSRRGRFVRHHPRYCGGSKATQTPRRWPWWPTSRAPSGWSWSDGSAAIPRGVARWPDPPTAKANGCGHPLSGRRSPSLFACGSAAVTRALPGAEEKTKHSRALCEFCEVCSYTYRSALMVGVSGCHPAMTPPGQDGQRKGAHREATDAGARASPATTRHRPGRRNVGRHGPGRGRTDRRRGQEARPRRWPQQPASTSRRRCARSPGGRRPPSAAPPP